MLIILSPAKIQNFKSEKNIQEYTLPDYIQEAAELMEKLEPLSSKELESLLNVNPDIARSAWGNYKNWNASHTVSNSKQAVMVYNGEVYRGLKASSLSSEDLNYAQKHLRIISGLYGVLRPLDLIHPYRLEMNTKLDNTRGNNLYQFWKNIIPSAISEALQESGKPAILLNLASNEYSKLIRDKNSGIEIIDFDFLENRHDSYKPIVIYTKKARGLMARYLLKNRIDSLEEIKGFDSDGYLFNDRLSTKSRFVFTR